MKWEEFLEPDNTINVLSSQNVWNYEAFFGPIERPFKFFEMKNDTRLISEVLLALELVPTRSWCRKNNWDWEISEGYSEVSYGSKRIKICLLILPVRRYTVEEIDELNR